MQTYIPSDVDKSNGFVVLYLTGNGNGSCDPVIDQKRIDIIPTPVVDLIPLRIIAQMNLLYH